jgi:hypothetical protein
MSVLSMINPQTLYALVFIAAIVFLVSCTPLTGSINTSVSKEKGVTNSTGPPDEAEMSPQVALDNTYAYLYEGVEYCERLLI